MSLAANRISEAPSGASVTKVCFKCNEDKPLSEFYKHKMMADGHLGKCKSCTKSDVKKDYDRKIQDEAWHEREKARGREKYYRLEYRERYRPGSKPRSSAVPKAVLMERYHSRYPEKKVAHSLSSHLRAKDKSNQLHHWSYRPMHAKDVIELSIADHYAAHRFIAYDQSEMMYRRKDTNELLDTREKHESYIGQVLGQQYKAAA